MKNSQLNFIGIIAFPATEAQKPIRHDFAKRQGHLWNNPALLAFNYQLNPEVFMKSLTLVFSAVLCSAAFPAFAGATAVPNNFITLAQAEVTIGPNGIGIGERGRYRVREHDYDRFDRDHDRDRLRLRGDRDRDCRTVTVQERGETRTTRRCD
jgi:hypothetical protein